MGEQGDHLSVADAQGEGQPLPGGLRRGLQRLQPHLAPGGPVDEDGLCRLKFRDGNEVGHQPAGQGFPLIAGEGVPDADLLPAELPAPVGVGHRGGVDGGFCHG